MTVVLDLPSTRAEAWRWADGALSAAAALAPVAAPEHDFLDLPGARLLLSTRCRRRRAPTCTASSSTDLAASDHALGRHAHGPRWRLALDRKAAADPVQVVHVATGREIICPPRSSSAMMRSAMSSRPSSAPAGRTAT
ncbi:hypothetical protein AB5I41_16675 [Sphingomonas sp. MMS24-JH45]